MLTTSYATVALRSLISVTRSSHTAPSLYSSFMTAPTCTARPGRHGTQTQQAASGYCSPEAGPSQTVLSCTSHWCDGYHAAQHDVYASPESTCHSHKKGQAPSCSTGCSLALAELSATGFRIDSGQHKLRPPASLTCISPPAGTNAADETNSLATLSSASTLKAGHTDAIGAGRTALSTWQHQWEGATQSTSCILLERRANHGTTSCQQ